MCVYGCAQLWACVDFWGLVDAETTLALNLVGTFSSQGVISRMTIQNEEGPVTSLW